MSVFAAFFLIVSSSFLSFFVFFWLSLSLFSSFVCFYLLLSFHCLTVASPKCRLRLLLLVLLLLVLVLLLLLLPLLLGLMLLLLLLLLLSLVVLLLLFAAACVAAAAAAIYLFVCFLWCACMQRYGIEGFKKTFLTRTKSINDIIKHLRVHPNTPQEQILFTTDKAEAKEKQIPLLKSK